MNNLVMICFAGSSYDFGLYSNGKLRCSTSSPVLLQGSRMRQVCSHIFAEVHTIHVNRNGIAKSSLTLARCYPILASMKSANKAD